METVLIAANPKSGSKDRRALVLELQHLLTGSNFHCEIIEELETLKTMSHSILAEGKLRTVVAAGGDGTVSAIASNIPDETPITVFPLGSENLLASYLSLSRSPSICHRTIQKGQCKEIDAMSLNDRISTLMASIGFDADIVRRVHKGRKSHITRWAYRIQAISAWLQYRWPKMHIDLCSGPNHDFHAQWCFVFNIPKYAAGLQILDQAEPDDGLLDVCFFEKSGPIRGWFQFLDVMLGRHQKRSDWRHVQSRSVRIRAMESSADSSIPFQFDGDYGGTTPVTIDLLPKRLKLLC